MANSPRLEPGKFSMKNLKQAPSGVPVQFEISAFQTGKPGGFFVL
jgi:hypothetical protein